MGRLAPGWRGAGVLLLAALLGLAALGLSTQHPVAPVAVSVGLLMAGLLVGWRPQAIWFLLPALLPVMSFAPWTGWILIDESDLLVMACLAGGFVRWALDRRAGTGPVATPGRRSFVALWCLLAATLAWGVWIGLSDAGVHGSTLFRDEAALHAGHDSAWNTVRVAKSLVWGLLLGALMWAHSPAFKPAAWVARGMVAGLALVCLVVLWERGVYAGLFDFSLPYRTSAWFWEMHVGGGAIDAYVAMALPFAFWAVWTAPTAWRWAAANALMVVSVYTVLTTYSRGVYLAVLISLVFMGVSAWRLKLAPAAGAAWGRRTLGSVLLVLALEGLLVFGGGSFMSDRLSRSDVDLVGRVAHWQSGVGLLQSPGDWASGLGVGRFSAHYSREVPGGGYPGRADWQRSAAGVPQVVLSGPASEGQRDGYFALTQRIDVGTAGGHRVRLRAHSGQPAQLVVSVCERHLLYEFRCQWQWVTVPVTDVSNVSDGFQDVVLAGDAFGDRSARERLRQGVLAVAPAQAGSTVRLESLELFDAGGRQLLKNSEFGAGLQHWFPMSLGYFQPWHIDNLYLDVLIERGLMGLAVFALWVLWAGTSLLKGLQRRDPLAWVMAAAVLGMLSLGSVISVTEVPRVLLILTLLMWSSGAIRGQIEDVSRCN
ncbi:MAG: hypothetical protein U1E02_12370 [Hydrogenophaga sp.]|nr:hypothetical protein [Hydrogenophaga sp.]